MEPFIKLIAYTIFFINFRVVPLLFAIAFLFFVWNAFRYFILGANNEDDRARARSLMLYGIGAFVILVSIWGIVNLLTVSLGIDQENPIKPDYVEQKR